jgi:prevent-host-death family protein
MKKPTGTVLSVSHFKATCLEVLERVRRTGRSVVITKRGKPLAEVVPLSTGTMGGDWLGSLRGSAQIAGDLVAPAGVVEDWDALRK